MKALLGVAAIAIGLSGLVAHDPPKKPKRKPVVRLEDEGNGAALIPPDEAPAAGPPAAPSPPVSDASPAPSPDALRASESPGGLSEYPRGEIAAPSVAGTTADANVGEGWQETRASWYGYPPAACYGPGRTVFPRGETMWTAHKTLPCGTVVEVEHAGRTIRVAVRDRGPYVGPERELDLSAAAFAELAPTSRGVISVRWRVAES